MSIEQRNSQVNMSNLVELLQWRAEDRTGDVGYRFLADGKTETTQLTYAALDIRARTIGAWLQDSGMVGERALLLYPPGLEFIETFWGCLYAGVVAVPLPLPHRHKTISRLQAVAGDVQPKMVLTTQSIMSRLRRQLGKSPDLEGIPWQSTDLMPSDWAKEWKRGAVAENTLAYLQYTSGSTSLPKGVMITHGNVLSNLAYLEEGLGYTLESVAATWLPHFHDMGLVNGILQPLYQGINCFLMPPMAFIQWPVRWLQVISQNRVTHSGGPNFAYDLCVRQISPAQRAGLNLRHWCTAHNGAEQVYRKTIDDFTEAFHSCGFQKTAFYPAYGLAEATLMVSGGFKDEPSVSCHVQANALEHHRVVWGKEGEHSVRTLIGCGRSWGNTQVRIVDPESFLLCPSDRVGEIWVSGPGVANGYWNRRQETEETFQTYIKDTGEGPYLRTGDLGFVRGGELFVTGRVKDLIIIRGSNFYPQDIERTAGQSHPALRPGGSAAFSVKIGEEERVVVVQEIEPRHQHPNIGLLCDLIRQAVWNHHEVSIYSVVLVKAGNVPKTSSGKVQRHLCRDAFLDRRLLVLGSHTLERDSTSEGEEPPVPREGLSVLGPEERKIQVEMSILDMVARQLRIPPSRVTCQRRLSALGFDSLMAVELKNHVENRWGVTLQLSTLLQGPYIQALVDEIQAKLDEPASSTNPGLKPSGQGNRKHSLSYGQRALWVHYSMSPESVAYNVHFAGRLRVPCHTGALRRALQALVDRHGALRTTYSMEKGHPVQEVHCTRDVSFEVIDGATWTQEERARQLDREISRPFCLEEGPPFRAFLFHESPQESLLLLTAHHIAVDLWSLAVLMDELHVLYAAEIKDTQAKLDPLSVEYTDFVYWEAEKLAGPEGSHAQSYWQQQLAGDLPILNLPTDRPRPEVQTYAGGRVSFRLEKEFTQRVKTLAKTAGTTLYTVLLAIFQAFLSRYTGQEDVLVGTPVSRRSKDELKGLVGYFVNPLVLRAEVSGSLSFQAFLGQVHQTVLAALDHQDYPFELLVQHLQAPRHAGTPPVFQAMFVFESLHRQMTQELAAFVLGESGVTMKLGSLELESVDLPPCSVQVDVTLVMAEVGGGLSGALHYNSDLFDAQTAERLIQHFQHFLNQVVSAPKQAMKSIPFLSGLDHHRVQGEWDPSLQEYPNRLGIHQLIEAQVTRTPHAVAVTCGEEALTYQEVNERANQLAQYLQKNGVGPEVLVGLCLDRSPELIVGILGILKAAGAYVPIDPDYPPDRINAMLEDSQVSILLTKQHLLNIPRLVGVSRVMCLDRDGDTMAFESRNNMMWKGTPENMAYVIYTSGSSGKPKGVMVAHRSLVNHAWAWKGICDLAPGQRVLQSVSLSFDAAAEEIFPTLSSGATLVLPESNLQSVGKSLAQSCHHQQITVLHLPVYVWAQMVNEVMNGQGANTTPWFDSVRVLVIGGESPSSKTLRAWCDLGGKKKLVHAYGPTEATITTLVYELDADPEAIQNLSKIPIGRPIPNAEVYLLDPSGKPVPPGITGEIYISGDVLARGYLKHPELTAQKFMPHPYRQDPSARLFRSGDLGRVLADGTIEFVGRLDRQLKIRGIRVEPGEIEEVLMLHPLVKEAVVLLRTETSGYERLVSYLVLTEPTRDLRPLRKFLESELPTYMIPTEFLEVTALPRLPNGKIDRRGLPWPIKADPNPQTTGIAPRTENEKALATIWMEVLRVPHVGIHDNFFELGGDSILAIQISARANDSGITLTPKQIFQHPTIAGSATVAGETSPQQAEQGRVTGNIPLTPIQQWFFDQELPEPHHWNQALLLEVNQPLNPRWLEKAVEALFEHHDALRLRFVQKESGWEQNNVAREPTVTLITYDMSRVPEHGQQVALKEKTEELQGSLHLSNGPLMRVAWFDFGPHRSSKLLMVIHHLAIDMVSWRIVLEDLQTAYRQLARGEHVKLPAKTTSFKHWAETLRAQAQAGGVDHEVDYWLASLRGERAFLPVDAPQERNSEASACSVTVALDPQATHRLLREVPKTSRLEVRDVLMTALTQVLGQWMGAETVRIDVESHGREDIGKGLNVSRTVGWFTTVFPVCVSLPAETEKGEGLKRAKEQLRQIPNRGLGYGMLRYMRADETLASKLRHLPPSQISFNYLGHVDRILPEDSLFALSRYVGGTVRSKRGDRPYLLEVNCFVEHRQLKWVWSFSDQVFQRETIQELAQRCRVALESLLLDCQTAQAGGYTPADFPLAKLDQEKLNKLSELIEEVDRSHEVSKRS